MPLLLEDERAQIVDVCRRLTPDGLVIGTAGNVSLRRDDLLAVTPSGLPYDDLRPDLVCVVRIADGQVVDGPLAPASELGLHLAALRATREAGANAVVHTHSRAATALASLQGVDELPAMHYYVAMFGGPVRVTPYHRYGTPELAAAVEAALAGRTAALMGNHGAVVVDTDLPTAYEKALQLEGLCDSYLRALAAGTPRILSDDDIAQVVEGLKTYGQSAPTAEG